MKFVKTSCLNCSAINDEKLAKTQCQSKTAFDQPIIIIIIVIEESGWKVSDVQLPFHILPCTFISSLLHSHNYDI